MKPVKKMTALPAVLCGLLAFGLLFQVVAVAQDKPFTLEQ